MNFMIVGAGLTGSVIARLLAESGFQCQVIEKDNHVAGNCHTERDAVTGILKHQFGPRTLHSDNNNVWKFIETFSPVHPYSHKKKAWVKGKAYSFPINIETINNFFGVQLNEHEVAQFLKEKGSAYYTEVPANFEEAALSSLGLQLYEGFFKGYTKKQWGRDPKTIPASVFGRLPIHFKNESNVYHHKRQGQPIGGYTKLVEKILAHKNIRVEMNRRFSRDMFTRDFSHLFYSGPLDEYFEYAYGQLPYRSLRFEHDIRRGTFQNCGTENYCDEDIPYTRIVEHKHFWPWEAFPDDTVITYEYSFECSRGDRPFYPIHLSDRNVLYEKYVQRAKKETCVSFVGRLGTYRYINMDEAIEQAMLAAAITISNIRSSKEIPAFFKSDSQRGSTRE